MYETLEYKYIKSVKVRTINNVILYWKEEYTRWPNQRDIEEEDHVLTRIKIDIQGVVNVWLASNEEIAKKVFFVLEL